MRIRTMLAAVTLGGAALTGLTATTAHASAVNWYAKDTATCKAAGAYEADRTPARFAVVVKDSRTAFWFLRADVAWWAKDRKQHAGRAELAQDRVMVAGDCTSPAAQEDS